MSEIAALKIGGRWTPHSQESKIVVHFMHDKMLAKHKKIIGKQVAANGYDSVITMTFFSIVVGDLAGKYCQAVMSGCLKDNENASADSFKREQHRDAIAATWLMMIIKKEISSPF